MSEPTHLLAVAHPGALPRPYYWAGNTPHSGTRMIVESASGGEEVVTVVGTMLRSERSHVPSALAEVTPERESLLNRRREFEQKAFAFAVRRARERRISAKFVRCVLPSNSPVRLYFASDGPIDYRDLIRDLVNEFGVEVDLIQLAPREAAGKMAALGPCGRPTCCSTFLKVFPTPNTRMAKDQGLSLAPQKLAGRCGKMKCCLAYEADAYREALEELALKVGHKVRTPKGYAKIIDLDIMRRRVRVALYHKREMASFEADEVERIKGGIPEDDPASGFFHSPNARPPEVRKPAPERLVLPDDNERKDGRKRSRQGGRTRAANSGKPQPAPQQAQQAQQAGETETGKPRRKRRRRRGGKGSGGPKGDS
jgi:cell fate regulator YaaT (PSP1 superfamily)